MKSLFYAACIFFLISCSNNDQNENCKYLLNIGVNITINLNLPEYSQLEFSGNSVYIPNVGNGGVIVASTGVDFYAWDAADPNVTQSECSILENSGLIATSSCEDQNQYSLVNGLIQGDKVLPCGLKNYRVEQNGNLLLIYN